MKRHRIIFLHLGKIRRIVKRFAVVFAFIIAFLFMMLSRAENVIIGKTTSIVRQTLNPIVFVLTTPAFVVSEGYNYLRSLSKISQQNKNLKEENRRLLLDNSQAKALKIENELLTELLNYIPPAEASFVSVKVTSREGDAFLRSITVYIDSNKSIKRGQVVVDSKGIVGRVEEVGKNYAKVFLINDINSKIPVMVEKTRVRGILSGENKVYPKMIFVPIDAKIAVGDEIVTSGEGGIFPTGLRVGTVHAVDKEEIVIKPFSNLNNLEYVQIVDYNMPVESFSHK